MYLVWGSVDHYTHLISVLAKGWRVYLVWGSVGHYTRLISVVAMDWWMYLVWGSVDHSLHTLRLYSIIAPGGKKPITLF